MGFLREMDCSMVMKVMKHCSTHQPCIQEQAQLPSIVQIFPLTDFKCKRTGIEKTFHFGKLSISNLICGAHGLYGDVNSAIGAADVKMCRGHSKSK